ncbi:hypothetical protein PUNSTDRAFT_110196 [Punctularia strigosozonata HHB-11173 SS5]|uniref:uncharacterized protein n=1 Tax=Punctularia strigosozonata (strain HHB-11173) TaxID=741275 RepID=UPI0004416CCC|nr:uncharacterized protein PUNSTDRAFT_110196 [Punctularia strigosozonata HHB-11173 SS5]EIN14056.1 hypothetical protein PUNSTDRAFT_110196 [Punctularia strigosozonata HHB-11173 SS5]
MSDNDTIRQRIISSVFSKRNAGGVSEDYVAHLKIWEETEDGSSKPRFILLAQTAEGSGVLHKSKLNTNGSFSVGKTWRLPELRGIEVVEPTSFNISLARTYKWRTDNARDQQNFLLVMVQLFRDITGGNSPLQVIGLPEAPPPGRVVPNESRGLPSSPSGSLALPAANRIPASSRPRTPSRDLDAPRSRVASPTPRSQSRAPGPSRPASPANGLLVLPSRPEGSTGASRTRPSSPNSSSVSSARPRERRRPSNATLSSRTESAASDGPPTQSASKQPPLNADSSKMNGTISRFPDAGSAPLLGSRPSLDARRPDMTSVKSTSSDRLSATRSTKAVSPAPLGRSRKMSSHVTGGTTDPLPQPRERNARVSFFDPVNQATLDRLISGADAESAEDADGANQETAQDTLASVEEMLEGYEWASEDVLSMKRTRGAAEQIESRLLNELLALEKASIHSFIESDDRVGVVLKYLDDAINDLDGMETLLSSYKIHLNAVSDDIAYIQSQNRGLQVQTQNQKALLAEIEQLMQTVHVNQEALTVLTNESLEKPTSIERLEEAAGELYKALQAGRDRDMAATMERLDEYRTYNSQFCKRLLDYLSIMFNAQAKMLLGDTEGISQPSGRGRPDIYPHTELENYLGRYSGLLLYLKEMDESAYSRICGAYFSAASDLHSTQMKALLAAYGDMIKTSDDIDDPMGTNTTPTTGGFRAVAGSQIRRAGTLMKSNRENRVKDKDRPADAGLRASEAFAYVLERIAPQIYREDEFLSDFLQINDAALTFADYMAMENYFRRQAAITSGLGPATMKLIRGALDLIFGFLQGELRVWIDAALDKDNMQIVGMVATIEKFLVDADERGNAFCMNVLEKQHSRLKALYERHINEQIKIVEDTKLTSKKRKGVAPFIRHFPAYLSRTEAQLIGADTLEIRQRVNGAYDQIIQAMFDCLQQMAKISDEGEDKGQLNYHVILIENMYQFMSEMEQIEIGAVAGFSARAEAIYRENVQAYVKIVLRRPFAKIIEYFDGVERLLKTTAPSEVSNNASYNKSALKRVVKEYTGKDIRKHVDVLYKRVEKHFTIEDKAATPKPMQASDVLPGVWKACEDELLRITDLFNKRIAQCYEGSGVSLEYSSSDVEAAFKKHQTTT